MFNCQDGMLGCTGTCDHPYDGLPGSCASTAAEGTAGGHCRTGAFSLACDDGLRCVDSTCIPCGVDGKVCCTSGTASVCNPGVTCVWSGSWGSDYPMCEDSCGTTVPGKDACCPGSAPCGAGVCDVDTQKCKPVSANPCSSAPLDPEYTVWLIDAYGCALGEYAFHASSPANAQAYQAQNGAAGFGPLNQDPTIYEVCGTSPVLGADTRTIAVFDTAKLASCELQLCEKCTWTSGACQ